MNVPLRSIAILWWMLAALCVACSAESQYPAGSERLKSPGNTTYFVDPVKGDDTRSGLSRDEAWRTFQPVNARFLASGDRIEIISPGTFQETLMPMGAGTENAPIEIRFARGRYDFYPTNAIKLQLHISNSNDDPYTPKAVAILLRETRYFRISGDQADVFIHGKMIEAMFDHAEDISLTGVAFDYQRPLVSEFTVLDVGTNFAVVSIQRDSDYAIEDGRFIWVGEGWRSEGKGLNQECDPADDGRCWRRGSGPLTGITRVEELERFKVRFHFEKNPGFTKGRVIQFRETFRDCAGGLVHRSKNITWKDCAFHALGGMGIVHQFSENVTYDHVEFAPRRGSGRTTCGWADLLHFSGCRGEILVTDCRMSGSHDDPINVHGTHLRVVNRPAADQVVVRFMHPQTYGLDAFGPGDEIEFVNHLNLRAYATNRIKTAEMKSDKEILLTLEAPAPEKVGQDDVVENVTWTPSVIVRRCHVSVDSCRGFLLTTRRRVLIEDNTFLKTTMSAIDVSDDANSWFESGPVRDLTIRGNRFVKCGEPVIRIMPEIHTANPGEPVHENIRILDNWFELAGNNAVSAKGVRGLAIRGNHFSSAEIPVHTVACDDVEIEGNQLNARSDDPAGRPPGYQPSGDYYDWRQSMRPERPWFHRYDQSLVMKMFLAERTDGGKDCKVYLTFEQALKVIERLDRITCGAPKIVYLVGWQYNGHDSKYPAWGEVNHRLKRAQDGTALESLKWLMREGLRHHTTVSLHINAFDAYEDSPLWADYVQQDIIAKDKQGRPLKGEMMGDLQSYQLSYAKEWETGRAKERIDGLLRMLPELKEAHTIHIDAFHTYPPVPHAYPRERYPERDHTFKGISPWLGCTAERECAAQRKTIRYFRDYGLDVTSEGSTFLRPDAFVGLQPMAWDYQPPAPGIPPRLYCGTAMRAEPEIKAEPIKLRGLTDQFCLKAAPQIWANAWCERHRDTPPGPAEWTTVLQGTDSFVPLVWKSEPTLLAYSRGGYRGRSWKIPTTWPSAKRVSLARFTVDAVTPAGNTAIEDGCITLTLAAGEALLITPE